MGFLLYSIHVVVAIFLILVVLLQQGKGADLSVFGGGSTMTAFGARGAATLLHKLTVVGFVLFMVTTLGIGVYESNKSAGSTVMTEEEATQTEEPAEADVKPEAESFEEDGALPEDDAQAGALPEDDAQEDALPEDDASAAEGDGQELPAGAEPSLSPADEGEGGETGQEG